MKHYQVGVGVRQEGVGGGGGVAGKLLNILGLIGLEFYFPWQHIAPIDL